MSDKLIGSVFLSTLSLRRATHKKKINPASQTFLSTLSLRRATNCEPVSHQTQKHFYPRSPCGERRSNILKTSQYSMYFYPRSPCGERHEIITITRPINDISIHALLAESDGFYSNTTAQHIAFLSTLSLRRATAKVHKTVGHFCAYETNFMEIASSC